MFANSFILLGFVSLDLQMMPYFSIKQRLHCFIEVLYNLHLDEILHFMLWLTCHCLLTCRLRWSEVVNGQVVSICLTETWAAVKHRGGQCVKV